MNDYKKLAEMLRSMSSAIIREDANALADAADAIEQLMKERDILRNAINTAHEDRRKAELKATKLELEIMYLKEKLEDMKREKGEH